MALGAEDVDLKRGAKDTSIGNTEDIRDPVRETTLDDDTHRGVSSSRQSEWISTIVPSCLKAAEMPTTF
jgi:hypothetical protein